MDISTCANLFRPEPKNAMHQPGCNSADHPALGRRALLQVGGIGLLGTGLADLLRLESQTAGGNFLGAPRAKTGGFSSPSAGAVHQEHSVPHTPAPAKSP